MSVRPNFSAFIKLFNSIAGHRHRYEVFRDFVTMTAIALHNGFRRSEALEAEYLGIVKRYDREAINTFPKLLAELVELLQPEPTDILGQLYMQLELGNEHVGQFFTPPELSLLIANVMIGDELNQKIASRGFVTFNEPACGAGGMVLAFAKTVIEQKHNPANVMWASCQDIDRTAALMCFIQLTLWNIPAEVVVGNTLAVERREVFYTPAHWMGLWNVKMSRHREEEQESTREPHCTEDAEQTTVIGELVAPLGVLDEAIACSAPAQTQTNPKPSAPTVKSASSAAMPQLGFDFDL
jgi:hypothetical protein